MTKDNLFSEFQSVSEKQWKQKIQMDLKGANYNDTLIAESNEGIKIKPFYHKNSFKTLAIKSKIKAFKICQNVFIADEKIAGKIANNAVKKGASVIILTANKTFNIEKLFLYFKKNKKATVFFKLNFLDEIFVSNLITFTSKNKKTKILVDVIGNLTKSGNWFSNKIIDFKYQQKIASKANSIFIDATNYQNAGANIVQQITYTLAHLNEYLNQDFINAKTKVSCQFSVGSNYFFEIAKIRAFRYLFKKLISTYSLKIKLNIIVQPTLRNKTIYDYNSNMLRTTTECMSAILGGADMVSNVAYDAVFNKSNKFGERIARNQLLILQEESHYKKANVIADNSYYIEELTYELAEKSLKLFKDIEKNGGFLAQLTKGTIQRKIDEAAKKEQNQFDKKETVLLGTNIYINEEGKMKDNLQLFPFLKNKARKTLIKPIISKRLAEIIEQKRLALE